MASESELIAALSDIFASSNPDLITGIGDDGAVAKALGSHQNIVMATDIAVEGVHFNRAWSNLKEIGAKITAANLADIFAMGGDPKYLLIGAALPQNISIEDVRELAFGIKSEADLVGCDVVGGDISKSPSLTISIAAIGSVETPITRAGAKVGDKVYVSNLPGYSAAGLWQLENGEKSSEFISQHKAPKVNYVAAKTFRGSNSLIDISDGLISECGHISKASSVAIELDAKLIEKIPTFNQLNELSVKVGQDVWQWILTGGEDHAFLGTGSEVPNGAFEIGIVKSGSGLKVNGASEIKDLGWRHF
jgi:thiamine-monophosphate kinase